MPGVNDDPPPVVEHLDAAVENAANHLPSLAATIHALTPRLTWTRTASYVADPPDQSFLAGYAHATVLGPADSDRSAPSTEGASIGLVLLGPGVEYPPHHHPADEVYIPCSRTWWADGSGLFTSSAPGDVIHHEPWQPHAMRVLNDDPPALLVYLWTGDVVTPSRWQKPLEPR